MGKLFTPQNLNSGFNSNASLIANFDAIEDAFDKTLSRTGETPNQMEADLDMNGKTIFNATEIDVDTLVTKVISVNGGEIPNLEELEFLVESLTPDSKEISGTYTLRSDDKFRTLIATATTEITIPNTSGIEIGWYCHVQKATTGNVTFTPATGETIQAVDDSNEILEQWGWVSVIKLSDHTWGLVGNLA